jgi:hypothetical protein
MLELILDLRAMVVRLEKPVAELEVENKQPKDQLRESKRSKAFFTKGRRVANPKAPGRKPGQGTFTHRAEPTAAPSDKVREVGVPLPIDQGKCLQGQTALEISEEIATINAAPAASERIITRFTMEVGMCPHCDYQMRGQHSELAATQNGANAHVIGPRVLAQVLVMHYGKGLPLRKVPEVIHRIYVISLTQSALTQRGCGLCDAWGGMVPAYGSLQEEIVVSPVSHTDGTGWRISTVLAFVSGFFTKSTAYYQIRFQHCREEVQEVIRTDYVGGVVTDRGRTYRAKEFHAVEMKRCLSHLTKVEKQKVVPAKVFFSELKRQLKFDNEPWKSYQAQEMGKETYRRLGRAIYHATTHHRRHRHLSEVNNQRLLDGIGLDYDNGRLPLFLDRPEVPPTNNCAERMLRPAVIARKVSQCSEIEREARTYGLMKSLFVTFNQRPVNAVKGLANLYNGKSFAEACKC